ncbi:OstA-like protein [Aquimarina sp. 2201CG5-10]|uniref:OstA-like protein n=1 Tax=Aquimarina callyspongiae TaxID=3098150 RepID=UPI002AB3F112|nr:OstA-like protein [Aquimarina sp. 2201CG5-10]MDY8133975.1 OstA-like protein [Aquimarina sp. 2201CG5-10]
MKNTFLYITFLLLFSSIIMAQEGKKIKVQSDRTIKDQNRFPGATILAKVNKQVYMEHEGIEIWCDQAVHYGEDRFVKAFGNVKIKQGDTLTMTSTYAEYNGNTQFAYASEKVFMETPSNTLRTDTLFFDRLRQQAYYRSGGTVKDSSNTLTSRIGRYFMERKQYSFNTDVKIVNPENTVDSDRLDYYTENGHAYLYGPSTVKGKESTLYCERGFYDTKVKTGYAIKNARIDYDNRTVFGDSIFYNSAIQFASATNNIKVLDTANSTVITGHYAEVFKDKDSVFITKRALAATLQEKDSIYIHSDTLRVTGKPEHRIMNGFYDVRIYKSNMSGKSDSINVDQTTGYTKMIGRPIIWSQKNQMTGDTIKIISNTETEKLDSLVVYQNAFLVQEDTLKAGYNQVKGQTLYGLFKDNEIYQVDIDKNTETIFYQRESEGELKLIGINKVLSSSITLLLNKQEIEDVYYYQNVDGTLYREGDLPENARELSGFNWRGEERITSKADLFRGEAVPKLTKITGIPLPKDEADFFDEETIKRLEENKSEGSRLLEQKLKDAELKETNEELDSITPIKQKKKLKIDPIKKKDNNKKTSFIDPNLNRSAKERDSITVTSLQHSKSKLSDSTKTIQVSSKKTDN